MKARALVSCILLSILILLFLSTATQASEYREVNTTVKADDILQHIANGDDIYLTNCRIVGELDASNIKLETVPDHDAQTIQSHDGGYVLIQVVVNYMSLKAIYVYRIRFLRTMSTSLV
jgi:hypothetical protein